MGAAAGRRYDLDWLRVIAFALLIFYHLGMYYVSWGWHVKSPYAGPFLEPAMLLMNPWRLPLLFFISGVAVRFAADRAGERAGRLARDRFRRLFVPLLFGALVIVPPQTYFELLSKGEIGPGYLDFYARYLMADGSFSVIVPTWNHLWYVAYMLVYSLVALLLIGPVRRLGARAEGLWRRGWPVMVLPMIVLALNHVTLDALYPETHALADDWGAHVRYGFLFLLGLMVAKSEGFWAAVARLWKGALVAALVLGAALSLVWADTGEHGLATRLAAVAGRMLYAWAVIIAVLGAGQVWLNRPGPLLTYLTKAIFPFYILHQTIIVLAGVALSRFALGAVPEFLVLLAVTFLGSALLYECVIRRSSLLRPLFGVFGDAPAAFRKPALDS